MALDLSKLENVRGAAHGKKTARCPACAAAGGDAKGEHLVIYPDGKFGCAANPDDKAHRKEIFSLAGGPVGAGAASKISVNTFNVPDSHVKMDLGRFGRFSATVARKTVKPDCPPVPEAAPSPPSEPKPVPRAQQKPVVPPPRIAHRFVNCDDSASISFGEAMARSGCMSADIEHGATDEEIKAFLTRN